MKKTSEPDARLEIQPPVTYEKLYALYAQVLTRLEKKKIWYRTYSLINQRWTWVVRTLGIVAVTTAIVAPAVFRGDSKGLTSGFGLQLGYLAGLSAGAILLADQVFMVSYLYSQFVIAFEN